MHRSNQDNFIHICSNLTSWDYAINVAERQIKEAEEKIKQLKMSIQTFEEFRAKGEPFPGESDSQAGLTHDSTHRKSTEPHHQ